MALGNFQGCREVSPVSSRGVLRCVLQPQELRRILPVGFLLLGRPAGGRALAPWPSKDVAPQRRLLLARLRGPDLVFQLSPLRLLQVVQAVAVNAAAAGVGSG